MLMLLAHYVLSKRLKSPTMKRHHRGLYGLHSCGRVSDCNTLNPLLANVVGRLGPRLVGKLVVLVCKLSTRT